jgi:putative oxidoreductase
MGVPLPAVSAVFAAVVELVGGLALLAGAATVVAGALVVLDMLGAFVLVHVGNGVFVTDNGFELVAVIAAAALLLVAAGPGRFSVDHALAGRRRATATV